MATEYKCKSSDVCIAPACICPKLERDESYDGAITAHGSMTIMSIKLYLHDLSHFEDVRRYLKYNRDLIFERSTAQLTDDKAVFEIRIKEQNLWLITFLTSYFKSLKTDE